MFIVREPHGPPMLSLHRLILRFPPMTIVQRPTLPSGGILYVNTRTGPPVPVRARTKTRPPDSSKIIPSINANANLGILIVVLPFCHQFRRTLCSFSQEPAFT